MSTLTIDDDMVDDSSISVSPPLYFLATLGVCCLAVLGKAFATIWNPRGATEVGILYAGRKEPLLPPPSVPQPAQPPPLRQPRGPPRTCSAVEKWLESLILTAEAHLDTTEDVPNRFPTEEGPKTSTTLEAAALLIQILKQNKKEKKQRHHQNKHSCKSQLQSASKEMSELPHGRPDNLDKAVAVTESVANAKKNVWKNAPSDHNDSMVAMVADDEVSVADEDPP